MNIHLIAMGGSIMHNLAIALHNKAYHITGSDDEIFNPAKSRLEKYGLLPDKTGWDPDRISSSLDAVIVGMHARPDNPELLRAKELNIKVYSFPEYVFEQTKHKKRIVVGGSHGKTTITSMVMHVLQFNNFDFDYLVGSKLEGFDTMVKLTNEAPIAIFEGDEYLSSPLDKRPKFHLYNPHIALISGIAWDHVNVFPTFEYYLDQFRIFLNKTAPNAKVIYQADDENLKDIISTGPKSLNYIPYHIHPYETRQDRTVLLNNGQDIPVNIFGKHNMQNLEGAKLICLELGVTNSQFYKAISTFTGAAKRMQLFKETEHSAVFFDFAHSPSKLKATVQAAKEQYNERKLIAVFELHTFSSLKEDFLPQYKDTMEMADLAIVYYSPETLKHKKLKPISPEQVKDAFGTDKLNVCTHTNELINILGQVPVQNTNFLIMSSGNFSGLDFNKLIDLDK
ncbi:MAG: peptidoglycan synthetase [Bacteroidetes bacterium]|nr:MAG: peptidoglycan synthetase [Bacteroidota bacterium]